MNGAIAQYIDEIEAKYSQLRKFLEFQLECNPDIDYDINKFIKQNGFILYEKLPLPNINLCVAIEFSKSGGYGDLLIGYKITQIILNNFKNSSVLIISSTPDEVVKHGTEIIEKVDGIISIDTVTDANIKILKRKYPNFTVVVLTLALETDIDKAILDNNGIRHIFIDEYHGWRASEQMENDEDNNHSEYDGYMIPGFGINPCGLVSCGININREKSATIENFQDVNYYFGYVSSASNPLFDCAQYIYEYIMTLIDVKGRDLRFFIVCDKLTYGELLSILLKGPLYYKYDPTLIIGSQSILGFPLDLKIIGNMIVESRLSIEIILDNYLPHDEMLKKIKYSQSPVLITGDQSLAEAISFEKLFIYQPHPWKMNLINSFQSYCYYRYKRRKRFLRYLKLATQVLHSSNSSVAQLPRFFYDNIKGLSKLLKTKNLVQYSVDICRDVKKNFDIESSIISVIKKFAINNEKIDNTVSDLFKTIITTEVENNKAKISKRYKRLYDTITSNHQLPNKKRKSQ